MAIEKVAVTPELNCFVARPEGDGPFPAVILFTEGLGLNSDMLEHGIQRIADEGILGIAPDLFHGDVFGGADREAMIAKITSIKDDAVLEETTQTIAYLDSREDVAGDRIGGIGFCMGGRLAFLAHGVFGDRIRATAAFYGGGIAPLEDRLGRKPLLDKVMTMKGALLLGYGADDPSILTDEHARIVQALSMAKRQFSFHLFEGAGHAFLSNSRPSYNAVAAGQAWPTVFEFFHRYLAPIPS